MNKRCRIISIMFLGAIMLTIFSFSHQPGTTSIKVSNAVANTLQIEQQHVDKAVSTQPIFAGLSLRKYAHVFLYFLLGTAAYLVAKGGRQKTSVKVVIAFGICFLYSCSDELHQMFIPGRGADVKDLLVDAVGYGTAILGKNFIESMIHILLANDKGKFR